MSNNLPKQPTNTEEVDLGQLFNAIGKLFDRFINFITSIFKALFSFVILTLKSVFDNLKIIAAVMLVAAIAGYFYEKSKPDIYSSTMVIRPYFDTKYQLVDNIAYFNALIRSSNKETLSSIFSIDEQLVNELVGFEVEIGPETENDKLIQYDEFKKAVDSTIANSVSFDDFIDNRSIYSGSLYQVTANSTKADIFKALESGFSSSFANEYSTQQKAKRDSLIVIQKTNILASIEEVQKLQNIYINVLEEGVKEQDPKFTLGDGLSLSPEKTTTKEYELLNEEIRLRNELQKLDEQKIQEDNFFDIVSSFQKIGNKTKGLKDRYMLIFPILAFILLSLGFVLVKLIIYVKNYED